MSAKHVWKNRQNLRTVLVHDDQYQRAQTVKMKDQEPVIKIVTPVEQATEMAQKRSGYTPKKNLKKPPTRQTHSKPYDDPSSFTAPLPSSHHQILPIENLNGTPVQRERHHTLGRDAAFPWFRTLTQPSR